MKTKALILSVLFSASLLFGCGGMTSTVKGRGAIADSPAGRQASAKSKPGSLGAFLYARNRKASIK